MLSHSLNGKTVDCEGACTIVVINLASQDYKTRSSRSTARSALLPSVPLSVSSEGFQLSVPPQSNARAPRCRLSLKEACGQQEEEMITRLVNQAAKPLVLLWRSASTGLIR